MKIPEFLEVVELLDLTGCFYSISAESVNHSLLVQSINSYDQKFIHEIAANLGTDVGKTMEGSDTGQPIYYIHFF